MRTCILILQIMCILLVTAGILIEYHYEADLGFILITAAGLLFAVIEKLDKRRLKRDIRGMYNSQKTDDYE